MIEIKNLNKFFNKGKTNEIHVINNVSINLPDCGLVALFGKSGCGKTTLLNVIGGLDDYSTGSIYINGKKINKNSVDIIRNEHIGYIFQNYCLNKDETVLDNVIDALLIAGEKNKEIATEKAFRALSSVSMDKYARRKASELSGGQQQRVAIARAIVKGSDIILADEPTGNLDNENTLLVMSILKSISKTKLVLLVTHEEDLVKNYCDKIIQIVDGKITSEKENITNLTESFNSKNNIYLNELESHTFSEQGLTITYYGDVIENTSTLLILAKDGKLYIKPTTKNIQILNENSELQLLEKRPEISEQETLETSIENFDKINNKKKGNLYTFGKSFIEGFRFTIGKKQKGQKALRLLFVLFTIAVVFLSASLGSQYYNKKKLEKDLNPNEIYLHETSANYYDSKDTIYPLDKVRDKILNNPEYCEYAYTIRNYNFGILPKYRFMFGNFESFTASIYVDFSASTTSLDVIKGKSLMFGKIPTEKNEIVISSAVADDILLDSKYSFLKTYKDLLNYKITPTSYATPYIPFEDRSYTITGIYKSSVKEIYCNNYALAILNMMPLGIYGYINDNQNNQEFYEQYTNIKFKSNFKELNDTSIEKGHCILYINFDLYDKLPQIGDTFYVSCNNTTIPYIIDSLLENKDLNNNYTIIISDDEYNNYICSRPCYFDGTSDYIVIYETSSQKRNQLINEIKSEYPSIEIDTFDTMLEQLKSRENGAATISYILLIGVIVILCISIFFVMRTALFTRIKEIGIARAIGVNKKNIVFKFFIEAQSIVIIYVFLSHLISSAFIWRLMSISSLIFGTLYYPIWIYALSLILLIGIVSLAAIMPVITLLRKTPAQILSKYDI